MEYFCWENYLNFFLYLNGLLYVNGMEKVIIWMNFIVNGCFVIFCIGYIVEINVLWYNVLCFISELLGEGGNNNLVEMLNVLVEKMGKVFVDIFLNEYGYLLDYVDGNMMDWSVCLNMIFIVVFDYFLFDVCQKKGVLDIVIKELFILKGFCLFSLKSGGYNLNYVGFQMQCDYVYY